MHVTNILLWIFQLYLAYWFYEPVLMKLRTPAATLAQYGLIKPRVSATPIRILAILELLGIVGIILPWALNICPILTPIAACGFACVMLGAFVFEMRKKNSKSMAKIALAFVLSVIVAYMRFKELGFL